MELAEQARGKWPRILEHFGLGEFLNSRKHYRCPKDGSGTDRFRFSDHGGAGRYFCGCSRDGRSSGFDLLVCCKNWTFPQACREVEKIVSNVPATPEKAKQDPAPRLREIWLNSKGPLNVVTAYLRRRFLEPVEGMREGIEAYWNDGKKVGEYPCMIAQICNAEGKAATFHLTFLDVDQKAPVANPRKIMTPTVEWKGGAVRLFPAAARMGVAEGIETALSAAKLYKIPVWASLNAENLSQFIPPPECKELIVFGDNDANFTGQAAAYACARRAIIQKGLKADVLIPGSQGEDWNDVLKSAQA